MTNADAMLGPEYDAPALLAGGLTGYEAKRDIALGAFNRAEASGDSEVARVMFWELGLIDLDVVADHGRSPYGGGPFEPFAAHYRFTNETAAYARERAAETRDVVLRIHYLMFVLLRAEQRGRGWINLHRELLDSFREFVAGCMDGAANDADGHAGVHIGHALAAMRALFSRRGVVRPTEAPGWSQWIIDLAERSRDLPEPDARMREQQRHRWIASYLSMLTTLSPTAAHPADRERALSLLADAAAFYETHPLNDHFERVVADAEAALRRHWGESGTHEVSTRRAVAALRRRAELHRSTGNGTLTASFFREARRIVAEHRQYFTEQDVADLQRAEQASHARSIDAGEFARITIPLAASVDQMDLTRSTASETVAELFAFAVRSVPRRTELEGQIREIYKDTPLLSMIPRTVVGHDKVLGESRTGDQNLALDVQRYAMQLARTNGAVVGITLIRASAAVGLVPSELLVPLKSLELDAGTLAVIERGCERFIAQDFLSTVHILVPRFEDTLRQHLRALGVDTTRFQPDVGDGTSRTDDAPLGALMRSTLPDGRDVRAYFGPDLWDHVDDALVSQTGLNLRNDVAHGLVRPAACTVETCGIALALLYQLASVALNGP